MSGTDPTVVPIALVTARSAVGIDPLAQLISDINTRFDAGRAARVLVENRVGVIEAKPVVPDLTSRVTALEARPVVPDLSSRVTTLEARSNYATATLTTAGVIKANITQIARTTSPVAVPIGGITVVGAQLLGSTSVTVAGVALGDFITASFATAPQAGLTISAVQVTAANTVLVTFAATQASTVTATSQGLYFSWMR